MRFLRIAVIFLSAAVIAAGCVFKFASAGKKDAPTITCSVDDMIIGTVASTDEELLSYVTASDKQDGDLTEYITVSRKNFFVDTKTTIITYAVCDSDNNVTSLQKKFYLQDYIPPRIILENDYIFPSRYNFDLSNYASATDMIDGDLSSYLRVITTNYTTAEGRFYVCMKVSNSMADSSEIVFEAIVTDDNYNPYRVRLTDYIIYKTVDEEVDFSSYLMDVINKTEITYTVDNVTVDASEVDMSKPGTYNVYYRILDPKDTTETISMSRLVVVVSEE